LNNWLEKNRTLVFRYLLFLGVYLIFKDSIEALLGNIGALINCTSLPFRIGLIIIFFLGFVIYAELVDRKFLISKNINFSFIVVISCYTISRIVSKTIEFQPIDYHIKYLDIIYLFFIVHILLLKHSKWGQEIVRNSTNNFFIDDSIYEGVIDNELLVDELVDKVDGFYPKNSFSIGISASWGYGKSTFLHRFKSKYEEKNNEAVLFWFRVWKNKGSKAIIENFFNELAYNLSPYSSEITSDIKKYTDAILNVTPTELGKIIEAGKDVFREDETLENYYSDIRKAIQKIDRQVIILLDDLDRLEASEIIDTFRIIRALSDFSNVIFISGYDRKYLNDTLTKTKNKYLNKIFQFELNLLPYDERVVRQFILGGIRDKYVQKEDTEKNNVFPSFYTLFQGRRPSLITLNDVLGTNSVSTYNTVILKWNTFLKTYRDCKRFLNEFTFSFSFLDRKDVHLPEYILLKLLFFRYRELINTIFLEPENVLSCKKLDFVNDKLQDSSIDYGDVFVFDDASRERLLNHLEESQNYSKEDMDIILDVFNKLFGAASIDFYQKHPNSISKIYYTQTYVRNGIAGASYKYSDFEDALKDDALQELIEATRDFTKQTMYQVQAEIKSFLFKQSMSTKEHFKKSLKGLNSLDGSFLPADNNQLIELIEKGKENLFDNSDDALEEVLSEIIKTDYIGNIDKLLSEIRINQLRKERVDLYNQDKYIKYDNPFELDKNLKDTLLNKLKFVIEETSRIDLLWEAYHLYTEVLAGDHMIIRSIEANELMKQNIVSKPHFHFWQDKFEFSHNTSGNVPDEYLDFKPNDFLAQIFSKPEDIKNIIKDPKNGARVDAMKTNGFKRYIEFIDSLDSLPAYSGDYSIERLKKILSVLEYFESEGFKPINGKKFKELWDSQPNHQTFENNDTTN